ncbi:unnamed protein product [Parajaminaea phylloscopi]
MTHDSGIHATAAATTTQPSAADESRHRYPDRQSAPGSAERNVDVISTALRDVLNDGLAPGSRVLELAAGHGVLTERLCSEHPDLLFAATEADESLTADIRKRCSRLDNFRGTALLDFDDVAWEGDLWETCLTGSTSARNVSSPVEPSSEDLSGSIDVVIVANVVHIVPWSTVENLFAKLNRAVGQTGKLCLYGAFNEDGAFTSEGNRSFDAVLKGRNPGYGLRDLQSQIIPLAHQHAFELEETRRVASGNLVLIFGRRRG